AESTVERLRNFRLAVKLAKKRDDVSEASLSEAELEVLRLKPYAIVQGALMSFGLAMDDDFNTAAALAALHNMVRDINIVLTHRGLDAEDRDSVIHAIEKIDSVLGIFGTADESSLDAEIEALVEERQEARRNRDFARSDEIRDLLAEKGIILEDTKDGVRWKRK
ncbi:MAG: hypothetical protein KA810_13915, partial [Pyrinomonadaceae bacterium]|nr:hypothetical protein [Pyrinomonadaceae bacterium]